LSAGPVDTGNAHKVCIKPSTSFCLAAAILSIVTATVGFDDHGVFSQSLFLEGFHAGKVQNPALE
jgi:hypothetical protein